VEEISIGSKRPKWPVKLKKKKNYINIYKTYIIYKLFKNRNINVNCLM